MRDKFKVLDIAHHRNGISGEPFYVVRFLCESGRMLAVVFPEPHHVAVISTDLLPSIEFGVNSWRGDQYEDRLRAAINEYDSAWLEAVAHKGAANAR